MKSSIPVAAAAVCGVVILAGQAHLWANAGQQADVIYTDCTDIDNWGAVGGIRGYSLDSYTCNLGDENLLWGFDSLGTPTLGMNAYRLENGRLMQIGLSNAKHSTFAAATPGCGPPCNGQGGSVLGVGCRDIYSANFNGGQSRLGNRSEINAWTGALTGPPGGVGNAIFRRLQIAESDLGGTGQYFVEGVYVALDDAGALGNGNNNASHKRVTVEAGFELAPTGDMQAGDPAILAWRDHGLGEGIPDPSVEVQIVDVPGEGRFYVLSKTTEIDSGDEWLYDYAIFNLNSDRAAGIFSVPTGGSAITGIGFHDVDYHSGEVYDNTDWTAIDDGDSVTWLSPETHAQNPNSNALRWGTMYNFWFRSVSPPTDVTAGIRLFKPGAPEFVNVTVKGPAAGPPCPGDTNGDGDVGFADVLAVLGAWGSKGGPEDVDGDGVVGFGDVLFILGRWGPCV